MMEHNCTELDAALMVAKDLDKKRGLQSMTNLTQSQPNPNMTFHRIF